MNGMSREAARLHEAAVRAAGGLDDFGDSDYREGLETLLLSLDEEAELTDEGRPEIYGAVVGALISRLTSEAGWVAHPQYRDVPVERPIFVVGLARSGTTAIHRMLAVDSSHQALEMWLGVAPQPRPDRSDWLEDPAFVSLDTALRKGRQGTATGKALHYLSADLPDECHLLTAQSFRANSFPSLAHVPSYVEWLGGQDWASTMQRHRRNLQLIGSNSPEKRWVLKNPGHLAALDGLLAVYPDAVIVHTHRDPRETIPSVASVIQYFEGHTSPLQNGEALARFQLDMFARDMAAFMAARERHPEASIVDVYYSDFVADPVGEVERVYQSQDLPMSQDVRRALVAECRAGMSGDRKPRNRYSLSDFDLRAEEVDERFAGYLAAHPRAVTKRF